MKKVLIVLVACFFVILNARSQDTISKSVTVSFILDHNRMLVDAEVQRNDGTWRKARLWVDSGSPDFYISESLARDLGIDLSAVEDSSFNSANLDFEVLFEVRMAEKNIDFGGVKAKVKFQPYWLFTTMQCDGNLPSSVLKKYHIVFDYPDRKLTIADQGSIKPKGIASNASINPQTGIVQLDAIIDGNNYSFALDMGASYSFISKGKLDSLKTDHPQWSIITGTIGHANMWGWWPSNEQEFSIVKVPEIKWGNTSFKNIGIVGVPDFSNSGKTLGEWYSLKTSLPVDGFLGANVIKSYRVEIDYANNTVYFEKGMQEPVPEMDMVGISVRQMPDLNYQILGIAKCNGKIIASDFEPEDIIISIDGFSVKGSTMGTLVDKLRGKAGDLKQIIIERKGVKLTVNARVEHFF